jgi:NTE family protein
MYSENRWQNNNFPERFFLNCLLCLFVFFISPDIIAQENVKRPTVGLVLSGGGAHGIAHLGVIKVMEEAGLRPDYITGVSMGSIIGGLYSIGYSADSLHKLLNKVNWQLLLSNKLPENQVIYHEKAHFYHSIVSLPISHKKIVVPSGLISGQQFESILSFYTWPAADINDFSRLPIPFRCLATDILSFKQVNFKSGYLADAIRASASVPSIFTPLKIDSMIILDGGLIRNFAASEVREMGADIVIGSYTGFDPFTEDDLQSVQGIMKRIGLFRGLDDFENQKKLVDLLIKPQTDEFPRSAFENVDSIFQKGYQAAIPYKEYFRKLADSLNRIASQKPMEYILDKQYYSFDKIEITGNKIYSDYQILGVLDIDPEERIDKYKLKEKIELLYGNAWFDKVKFRIVPRNDSLILVIDCIEKPQVMFYGSVHYDNSLLFGLILEMSGKNLLTKRSVINVNSFIGQFYRFEFNYLQFIDRNQKFDLSANIYTDNTLLPMLALNGNSSDIFSRNVRTGLGISRRLGLNQLISVSGYFENFKLTPRHTAEFSMRNLSYSYLAMSYDYNINTLDRKNFPDKGIILNTSAILSKLISTSFQTDSSKVVLKESSNNINTFDRFYTVFGNIKYFFSPVRKMTFEIGGDAELITDSDSVSSQNNYYLLGGIESLNKRSIPMVGFYSNEIPVKKMAGLRAEIDTEFFRNFHVTIMSNIFWAEAIGNENVISVYAGYSVGVGYMSRVGPLKIGLMNGNSSNEKYVSQIKGYFSFGYSF